MRVRGTPRSGVAVAHSPAPECCHVPYSVTDTRSPDRVTVKSDRRVNGGRAMWRRSHCAATCEDPRASCPGG
jgi:hypothetical protein